VLGHLRGIRIGANGEISIRMRARRMVKAFSEGVLVEREWMMERSLGREDG
jgi:tRNA-dihydrouridine synthase